MPELIHRRHPNHTLVLMIAVISLALASGCNRESVGPTTHTLYIRVATDNPARCTITDADGNEVIKVHPGDYVEWVNEYGPDVQLTFGPVKDLFGVTHATVSQTGGKLSLRVRDDADQSTHDYISSCEGGMGGPALVVCPPDTPLNDC